MPVDGGCGLRARIQQGAGRRRDAAALAVLGRAGGRANARGGGPPARGGHGWIWSCIFRPPWLGGAVWQSWPSGKVLWCAPAGVVPVWAAGHPGLWPLHGAGGPASGCVRGATSSQTRLVERGGLQWFLQPVVVGGGVLLCVLGHVAWGRTVGMLPETVCWAGCGEDGLGELRAKA